MDLVFERKSSFLSFFPQTG
nr:hypothetical protein [Sicyoidochytrium minutum DNA virus]